MFIEDLVDIVPSLASVATTKYRWEYVHELAHETVAAVISGMGSGVGIYCIPIRAHLCSLYCTGSSQMPTSSFGTPCQPSQQRVCIARCINCSWKTYA